MKGDGGVEGGDDGTACRVEAGGVYGLHTQALGSPPALARISGLPNQANVVDVGPVLPGFIAAMTFLPDGSLIASDNSGFELLSICAHDGAAKTIAPWSLAGLTVRDFTVSPAGDVYAAGSVGQGAAHIFQINPKTAAIVKDFGTVEVTSSTADGGVGETFDLSHIQFAANKLYGSSVVAMHLVDLANKTATNIDAWNWKRDPNGWAAMFVGMDLMKDGKILGLVWTFEAQASQIWTWDPAKPNTAPTFVTDVQVLGVLTDVAVAP